MVREKLSLKTYRVRNFLFSMVGREKSRFIDYAIWNTAFIHEFEKYGDYEFHVISPHAGMKKSRQDFIVNSVHYHFFKNTYSLLIDTIWSIFKVREKTDYQDCRNRISKILKEIQPDFVIVCGAEQPYYSPCILDIEGIPVYVLLQTLVSNPALRSVMKHSETFCRVEQMVFKKLTYVAAGKKYLSFVKEVQPAVKCLPITFPTYQPEKIENSNKEFDFVFYAASLSKNKGVEDVLYAYNKIYQLYPTCTLLISGNCDAEYLKHLISLANPESFASDKVTFIGLSESIEDKYKIVQKARLAILPGITAALNSTVRESMLMGIPTIVYETSSTQIINKGGIRLLEARMEDVEDLAEKMIFAYEHHELMEEMGRRGEIYALEQFSNKKVVEKLIKNVEAIYDNYYRNTPIPEELIIEQNGKYQIK